VEKVFTRAHKGIHSLQNYNMNQNKVWSVTFLILQKQCAHVQTAATCQTHKQHLPLNLI